MDYINWLALLQQRSSPGLHGLPWSGLKDDKTDEWFGLPQGKISVYTGIFPVAKTQGGLGAVLDDKVTHSWRDMVMNAGMLGQTAVVGAARDALRKA